VLHPTLSPQTGYLDHDKLEERALEFRPRLIICGGSAYPREWDYKRLRQIAGAMRRGRQLAWGWCYWPGRRWLGTRYSVCMERLVVCCEDEASAVLGPAEVSASHVDVQCGCQMTVRSRAGVWDSESWHLPLRLACCPYLARSGACVADKVGALLMMDMAHISGLVAAGEAAQVQFAAGPGWARPASVPASWGSHA
jgi:hypothetical protein